jgi:hypothetical protein
MARKQENKLVRIDVASVSLKGLERMRRQLGSKVDGLCRSAKRIKAFRSQDQAQRGWLVLVLVHSAVIGLDKARKLSTSELVQKKRMLDKFFDARKQRLVAARDRLEGLVWRWNKGRPSKRVGRSKVDWCFEILAEDKVPRAYCSPDNAKIRQAVADGVRKMAGVHIYQEERYVRN